MTLQQFLIKISCLILIVCTMVGCHDGQDLSNDSNDSLDADQLITTPIPTDEVIINSPITTIVPVETSELLNSDDVNNQASDYETISIDGLFNVDLAKNLPEGLMFETHIDVKDGKHFGWFGVRRYQNDDCLTAPNKSACSCRWKVYEFSEDLNISDLDYSKIEMGQLYIEPTMELTGNDGQTIFLYLVEGQDTALSNDTYQWYVDYLEDPSTLAEVFWPDNIIEFTN